MDFIVGGMGCPLLWKQGEKSGLTVQVRSDGGKLLGQGPLTAYQQAAINCQYRAQITTPESPDGFYVVDVGPGLGTITYSSDDFLNGSLRDTLTVNR